MLLQLKYLWKWMKIIKIPYKSMALQQRKISTLASTFKWPFVYTWQIPTVLSSWWVHYVNYVHSMSSKRRLIRQWWLSICWSWYLVLYTIIVTMIKKCRNMKESWMSIWVCVIRYNLEFVEQLQNVFIFYDITLSKISEQ